MNCAICGTRKPRRHCPGVGGEICTVCCGTCREETIDCPVACEYLRDAHRYAKPNDLDFEKAPNADTDISDEFMADFEWLVALLGMSIVKAARGIPQLTDYDIREALEALIQTYRVLQSGLYYEGSPANPYAVAVVDAVKHGVADLKRRAADEGDASFLRDEWIFKALIVLQRLEYLSNNGRKYSRAFLTSLMDMHADMDDEGPVEGIVEHDEPRIIL